MAKKKKAKKKGTRKPAPKKKSVRKSAAKSRPKVRKPVRKSSAKRRVAKPARPATSKKTNASARKPPTPAAYGPKVRVWPYPDCDIQPHGRIHAPTKKQQGQVNFYNEGSSQCTIHFDHDDVFGTDHWDLNPGDNYVPVAADPPEGDYKTTNVSIDGCNQGRILNGPTDIIVP